MIFMGHASDMAYKIYGTVKFPPKFNYSLLNQLKVLKRGGD